MKAEGFIQDRDASRRFFIDVWEKHRTDAPLQPLEIQLLDVILEHPEYHDFLSNAEEALRREFLPEAGETNPFLHMAMHSAIREQVGNNRPAGIRKLYKKIVARDASSHAAEHRMIKCLAETLWIAQRNYTLPDESAYLECIKRLER